MTDIKIENVIASSKISDSLNINKLSIDLPESEFNPEAFEGLTIKYQNFGTAVILLSNGKVVCTGAKDLETVDKSIKRIYNKLKRIGQDLIKNEIEIENIIVSTELQKPLNLDSIAKGLMMKNLDYEPDQFPGLIYRIENICGIIMLFSSGKLVCTGAKSLEEASQYIEDFKGKLSNLGVL